MSLSASSDRPLISAASPTTTAIRSRPWRRSRASARPSAIDRPVPAWPPSNTSCGDSAAPREAADAVELAERAEPLEPAGQQLVRVGLVAGVPDDPVARRLEQPMERDRELDDAERGAEVAAGLGDRRDDRLADLRRELGELGLVEAAQVGGPWRSAGWARAMDSCRGSRSAAGRVVSLSLQVACFDGELAPVGTDASSPGRGPSAS